MRVLLDEGVPAQVRNALAGHDVITVQQKGWAGIKNGELLAAAEADRFDLLILADKNLQYQQNLGGRDLAMLELWTNHRPTLEKHFAYIRTAAESIHPGEYRSLEAP